jgi:hypothetical protein
LNQDRREAELRRDKHKLAAEAEAQAILASCGLENDPLARALARQYSRLEFVALRLQEHLRTRGFFDARGEPRPALSQFVGGVQRLLDECRKMLDQLRVISGIRSPAAERREYHIKLPSAQTSAAGRCPKCHERIERPIIDVPRSSCRSPSAQDGLLARPVASEQEIEALPEVLPSPRRESAPEPARAEIDFRKTQW